MLTAQMSAILATAEAMQPTSVWSSTIISSSRSSWLSSTGCLATARPSSVMGVHTASPVPQASLSPAEASPTIDSCCSVSQAQAGRLVSGLASQACQHRCAHSSCGSQTSLPPLNTFSHMYDT